MVLTNQFGYKKQAIVNNIFIIPDIQRYVWKKSADPQEADDQVKRTRAQGGCLGTESR